MRAIGVLLIIVTLAGGVALGAVELQYFWARGCPECGVMSEYLEELQERYPELEIHRHEVSFDADNWRLMQAVADAYGLDDVVVPAVFVGEQATVRVGPAVELLIEEEVERCLQVDCPSPLDRVEEVRWRPSPMELGLVALVVVVTLLVAVELTSP
ncbi:MAG: hypothetical protein R6U88_03550 [Candidatus Bipolaricaulota bacterium]